METKDAGIGELEVICEAMGDRRVRLPVDIREDGHTYKVRLRPSVPAHYRIYITYGGKLYTITDSGSFYLEVISKSPESGGRG